MKSMYRPNILLQCARKVNKSSLDNVVINSSRFASTYNGPSGQLKLYEVGKFTSLKLTEDYKPGQLFLHRVFAYRGIIVFPWMARVFDRDVLNKKIEGYPDDRTPELQDDQAIKFKEVGKEVKGSHQTYYQVLIDSRDCPYIRAQTESVTFLGNQQNSRTLYAVPGLDYVSHEDIMPYSTNDKTPIRHDLFYKFFSVKTAEGTTCSPKDTLRAWQERNNAWLDLSDVHKETTEGVRVTVIPYYMGCRLSQNNNVYWWRYCVRLENLGESIVQLRERHWRIFSLSGTLETVRGRGVVGQEPVLSSKHPAFQYSSHVSLQSPSGHMWGTFRIEREDGHTFDCKIPPFSLESKHADDQEFD